MFIKSTLDVSILDSTNKRDILRLFFFFFAFLRIERVSGAKKEI